ncbi:MAG: ATP-binding protein [Anaerolineae bacterium]
MKARQRARRYSFSVRLQFGFLALALLITVVAVVFVLSLIRRQLDRQAWAQLEQGALVTEALYEAQQRALARWAQLLAERPTLQTLLEQGDGRALTDYLMTFRADTPLDCVLVCDDAGGVVARAGDGCPRSPTSACVPSFDSKMLFQSAQVVKRQEATVVVGVTLDEAFVETWAAQTGLDHTLFRQNRPLATTLSVAQAPDAAHFDVADVPYYARTLTLDSALVDQIALPIDDLQATWWRLVRVVIGSGMGLILVGALVGVIFAQQAVRPLAALMRAAEALPAEPDQPADAVKAVGERWRVQEVIRVALALEATRNDLTRTWKELQHEKAWIENLLDAIVEGIVTLDAHGRITFFSRGAEAITGWRAEEVRNRLCDEVFTLVETDTPFSAALPQPGGRRKLTVRLGDQQEAVLAVTRAELAPPSEEAHMALVFRDVSEEEIVHRLLGYFVANVAHEFRTPLAALAASVELLLDQAPYLSPAEIQELLNALHLSVLDLQTLINNLLESASIETGQFHVRCRDLAISEVIAEALHTMQPLLEKHDQQLNLQIPESLPSVKIDPRRTQQVLINLLDNASKYGPDGGEICLRVLHSGPWVRVEISDQGPGVPDEQRTLLFRHFSRTPAAAHGEHIGMGLGLSVVKAIVEAQGGEVGVDSPPGGGALFWFTMPTAVDKESA